MPGTYRYSATLDKTYRDDEAALNARLSSNDLSNHNGNHNRTCSMDSLDSISSCGGASLAGSSSGCSGGGAHSRQVSADSTSSPTNFASPSYTGNRAGPASNNKAPHNPHQFIQAGPSVLHKTASEQIKVVKEVVKTFRSPVKEDEEEWQLNLSSWKSKRRTISEKTIQRVDEVKQFETGDEFGGDPSKKKSKTFSQMRQDKARRPSYNLTIYPGFDEESEKVISDVSSSQNDDGTTKQVTKDKESSFDNNNVDDLFDDNSIKDKDDGYSSKDECNKTETDDQSDIVPTDDQASMITESSGVSDRELSTSYSNSAIEAFPDSSEDKLERESIASTPLTHSSEEDFASTAFHYSDDADELNGEAESQEEPCTASNVNVEVHTEQKCDQNKISNQRKTDEEEEKQIIKECAPSAIEKTLILVLKPANDVKDFGFTMKGDGCHAGRVLVDTVTPHGAAEKAGLTKGDCIMSINGEVTANRTHSSLVFAVKQAVYTGQLQLGILRNFGNIDMQPMRSASETSFSESQRAFLQKDNRNHDNERPSPSRETVSRRRSMFANMSLAREVPKSVPAVDVRMSLRDRVASFENINDSPFKSPTRFGSVECVKTAPPPVKPKPVQVTDDKSHDSWSKESVLNRSDLIETSIDSSGSDKDDEEVIIKTDIPDQVEQLQAWPSPDCHDQQVREEETIIEEVCEDFVKCSVDFPEKKLEELCDKLQDETIQPFDDSVTNVADDSAILNNVDISLSEDKQTTKEEEEVVDDACNDDVCSALDEALGLLDDSELSQPEVTSRASPPRDSNTKNDDTAKWVSSNAETFHNSDINIIYDSSAVASTANACDNDYEVYFDDGFIVDENFDRPRSIAEPPKEKPPPPPVDIDPQIDTPPMKRINSTKRIKKELWRRRSDFLGLSESQDDMLNLDDKIPKPRRQIDDLLRSELELEKSLPSPTLSSDHSHSSYEPVDVATFERNDNVVSERHSNEGTTPSTEELDQQADREEEERIRQLEIDRIEMQEARKKAEEERMIQQRVDEIRKQQEMLHIEKERLKREQDEVMKVRRSSVASSNGDGSVNVDTLVQKTNTGVSKSKPLPRAPPPPPPKPSMRTGQRSEVIRLSKRPTSGDFSAIDLGPTDRLQQPIQKQPLSRHSLQSLCAAPKANLNGTDSYWMKKDVAAKRRSDMPRKDAYSHWLIQEAEMRRIAEHTERKRTRGSAPPAPAIVSASNPLSYSKSDSNISRSAQGKISSTDSYGYSANRSVDTNIIHGWSNGSTRSDMMSKSYNQEHYLYDEVVSRAHVPGVYSTNMLGEAAPSSHVTNYAESTVHAHGMHNEQLHGDYSLYGDGGSNLATTNKVYDNMLSVSGRKKCSNCNEELGRGAAMIIESLKLFYHIKCFRCSVCQVQLGNGSCGADVRVRNHKLHCQNCYSNDEAGLKFSKV